LSIDTLNLGKVGGAEHVDDKELAARLAEGVADEAETQGVAAVEDAEPKVEVALEVEGAPAVQAEGVAGSSSGRGALHALTPMSDASENETAGRDDGHGPKQGKRARFRDRDRKGSQQVIRHSTCCANPRILPNSIAGIDDRLREVRRQGRLRPSRIGDAAVGKGEARPVGRAQHTDFHTRKIRPG
jgi:hypothetical protein